MMEGCHLVCIKPCHTESVSLKFRDELDELGQPVLQLINDALPDVIAVVDICPVLFAENVESGIHAIVEVCQHVLVFFFDVQ